MLKNRYFVYTFIFMVSSLSLSALTSQFQLIPFINHLFIAGLACLMIAALIYVVKGGFFTVFAKSMKNMMKNREKYTGIDDELTDDPFTEEDSEEKDRTRSFWLQIQFASLVAGIFCCLGSFVLVFLT
ncbi:DUF3899 domain-containing protein [Lihuaxuella thermophila]|uniref:DUF3899 domain-containing protein n=1 Tax=Lihuaxuella thermophila TaxID=1173111 RepID=A0A1H8HKY7_9BACL|nr:DUF3899 domain-containing protein [Lihuaxuella thermophila]SEN56803.1 protein of unknown function [Lihuaxuella thermophila]